MGVRPEAKKHKTTQPKNHAPSTIHEIDPQLRAAGALRYHHMNARAPNPRIHHHQQTLLFKFCLEKKTDNPEINNEQAHLSLNTFREYRLPLTHTHS